MDDHRDAALLDQIRYATETGVGVPMPFDLSTEPTLELFERTGWIMVTPTDKNGRGGLGWITEAGRETLSAAAGKIERRLDGVPRTCRRHKGGHAPFTAGTVRVPA